MASEASRKANYKEAQRRVSAGEPLESIHVNALRREHKKNGSLRPDEWYDAVSQGRSDVANAVLGQKQEEKKQQVAALKEDKAAKAESMERGLATPSFAKQQVDDRYTAESAPTVLRLAQSHGVISPENSPKAINSDLSHGQAIRDMVDSMSNHLMRAEDNGLITSEHTKNIDNALSGAYSSLSDHFAAHKAGDVNGSINHLKIAANQVHSAYIQMQDKQLLPSHIPGLHAHLGRAAQDIADDYANSDTPGRGARRDEGMPEVKPGSYTRTRDMETPGEVLEKQNRAAQTEWEKQARDSDRLLPPVIAPSAPKPRLAPEERQENRRATMGAGLDYTPSAATKATTAKIRETNIAKSADKTLVDSRGRVRPEDRDMVKSLATESLKKLRMGKDIPERAKRFLGPVGIKAVQDKHRDWLESSATPGAGTPTDVEEGPKSAEQIAAQNVKEGLGYEAPRRSGAFDAGRGGY